MVLNNIVDGDVVIIDAAVTVSNVVCLHPLRLILPGPSEVAAPHHPEHHYCHGEDVGGGSIPQDGVMCLAQVAASSHCPVSVLPSLLTKD